MPEERIVAVIPARGGSRRVPRKNLLPVGGRPLLAHTIEHARRASCVDAVYVSTDDLEIAELARAEGAEVIVRPSELAGDRASSELALEHSVHWLREHGCYPELVVFLQCTSPVRSAETVDEAVRTLRSRAGDSLVSVSRSTHFLWRRTPSGDGEPVSYDPRARPRSQDMEPQYVENGSIYVFKPWVLDRLGCRLGGRIVLYEMEPWESFEIDSIDEAELCDWILRRRVRVRSRAPKLPDEIDALVLDFDGVLTDNRVQVREDGSESVTCDRSDGLGLARLRAEGLPIWVLSTERNPVVSARCRKLGLDVCQGEEDKGRALREQAEARGLDPARIVYVGNDHNDLGCMRLAGFSVAVADAQPEVREAADWVLTRPGGRGAVRELCDLLLERMRTRRGGWERQ